MGLWELVAALLLTAIAGALAQSMPSEGGLVPLGLLLDLVPFAGALVATAVVAVRLKRDPVPLIRLLVSTYCYFAGALVATLGVAHLTGVLAQAIRRGYQRQFIYDFHFYSVVLLGVLLIAFGVWATLETSGVAQAHRVARRRALLVWTAILFLNVPLIPLQGFAVLFSALAAIAMLLILVTRPTLMRSTDGVEEAG